MSLGLVVINCQTYSLYETLDAILRYNYSRLFDQLAILEGDLVKAALPIAMLV